MRLQTSSAGLAIGDADNRYLRLAGGDLTGAVTLTKAAPSLYPADSTMPPAYSVAQEWGNASKTWTAFQINVTNTASGSASKLADFQVSGSSKWAIDKNGYPYSQGEQLFSRVDGNTLAIWPGNAYGSACYFRPNLGSGATALWLSNGVGFGNNSPASPDCGLGRNGAGVVEFNSGTLGTLRDWKARRGSLSEYLDITEMSAPAAPAANTARLYVEDNGSGKTRLMVLFPTGAAQVLATEP